MVEMSPHCLTHIPDINHGLSPNRIHRYHNCEVYIYIYICTLKHTSHTSPAVAIYIYICSRSTGRCRQLYKTLWQRSYYNTRASLHTGIYITFTICGHETTEK